MITTRQRTTRPGQTTPSTASPTPAGAQTMTATSAASPSGVPVVGAAAPSAPRATSVAGGSPIPSVPGGVKPTGGSALGQPGSRSEGWQNPALAGVRPSGVPMMTTTAMPGAQTSTFGPGNDLRYTQVTPGATPAGNRYAGYTEQAASALMDGPDRLAMARQALDDWDVLNQPGYQQRLQAVGQKAAALGRIGAGQTTEELTDVTNAYNRDRLLTQNELIRGAIDSDMQDRFGRVSAMSGLWDQADAYGRADRQEVRGERDYQYGVGRDAVEDQITAAQLEEFLTSGQFGRDLSLAEFAYSGNPAAMALGASGNSAAAGSASNAAFGNLLGQWMMNQTLRNRGGG